MVPSPALYRFATNRQYDKIPARVESHPEDVIWTDRYGSTCLHILCQARTSVDESLLRAVQAIVHHQPDVVAWANVATWTPLHFATFCTTATKNAATTPSSLPTTRTSFTPGNQVRYEDENSSDKDFLAVSETNKRLDEIGDDTENDHATSSTTMSTSTQLVLCLIEACPSAVSVRTKTGFKTKTPFHIACEAGSDYRILRAMLQINPTLAIQPFVQQSSSSVYAIPSETPLQLLWKHNFNHINSQYYRNKFDHPPRSIVRRSFKAGGGGTGSIQELHNKMALLLQAAHHGTLQERIGKPFRVLNAACSVRCPKDYVAYLLEEHTNQVSERDEKGLLPLHYAVRKTSSLESQTYTQFLVESLLDIYPEAASVEDETGRLPLHVALGGTVGLTWHKGGVQELVLRYPNALRTIDPQTKLVPFLQSAVHAIDSRLHLSTTYELLLTAPEMVQPGKWNYPHS